MTSSCTRANVCSSSSAAPDVDHDRVVGVAARADERAVAERGPEPLAAGAHELAQRVAAALRGPRRRPTSARSRRASMRVDARLGPLARSPRARAGTTAPAVLEPIGPGYAAGRSRPTIDGVAAYIHAA